MELQSLQKMIYYYETTAVLPVVLEDFSLGESVRVCHKET